MTDDLTLALDRVADATAASEARVMMDAQERYLLNALRVAIVDVSCQQGGFFTAADVGRTLDAAGVPRHGKAAMNLRKRLISTVINQGKRDGRWVHAGYAVSPRHGGPRTVWKITQ